MTFVEDLITMASADTDVLRRVEVLHLRGEAVRGHA